MDEAVRGSDGADVARQVGRKLAHEFTGVFSPETIEQFAVESCAVYSSLAQDAHTAGYLPVLIERFVRKRLEFAREEQIAVEDMPEVLFVCLHNAGRSQMAVALLEHHGHGRMHARSGGSAPTDRINPSVVAAMEEIDLDVSREVPKPVTAVPSSRRLLLFPPSQIEEPHPERLPLDLDQGLPHCAPDGLPGASSDNLPGDAIAR